MPAPAGEMVVVLGPGWPGILLHEAIGYDPYEPPFDPHGRPGAYREERSVISLQASVRATPR